MWKRERECERDSVKVRDIKKESEKWGNMKLWSNLKVLTTGENKKNLFLTRNSNTDREKRMIAIENKAP